MTDSFWKAAEPLIKITETHPFLVAMVDGTLNEENFKYYVIQDALYLKDFALGLRTLAKNSDISEADSKRLSKFAHGAEVAEMELHNSFFKKWGIDATGAKQMPNALLYTSYMLRVINTSCHAEGLAVLLPCFWVYMHVGKCMLKLREELDDSVKRIPQYDAWIDMYGGDEFEKEVKDYIAMVDIAAKSADEKTITNMKGHFIMCCKLEYMFWDQAQDLMKWPAHLENIDA